MCTRQSLQSCSRLRCPCCRLDDHAQGSIAIGLYITGMIHLRMQMETDLVQPSRVAMSPALIQVGAQLVDIYPRLGHPSKSGLEGRDKRLPSIPNALLLVQESWTNSIHCIQVT